MFRYFSRLVVMVAVLFGLSLQAHAAGYQEGTPEAPLVLTYPGALPHNGSMAYASAGSYYQITGLIPGEEYVVDLDTTYAVTSLVYNQPGFETGFTCSAWVSPLPDNACVATASANGELFVQTTYTWTELEGAFFTLKLTQANHEGSRSNPLDITSRLPYTTNIPIELSGYYVINGLTAGNSYTVTVNTAPDADSDLYIYQDQFESLSCSSTSWGEGRSEYCTFTAAGSSLWLKLKGATPGNSTIDIRDHGPARVYTPQGAPGSEVVLTLATPSSGEVDATASYYKVNGVTPAGQYRVVISNMYNDNANLSVYGDAAYTNLLCRSSRASTSTDDCVATAVTDTLWIKVDGTSANQYLGAEYQVTVYPFFPNQGTSANPVSLTFGSSDLPRKGSVDSYSYYLISGLAPNTSYNASISGYTTNLGFSLAKSFSHYPGCYSKEIETGVEGCILETDAAGTLAVRVYSQTPYQGTNFTLNVSLSTTQSEGSKTTPVVLALDSAALPHAGAIGGSSSYYQITGVTPGMAYTISLDGLQSDHRFYFYTDGSKLGSTSSYDYVCEGYSPASSCTRTAVTDSIWIMVARDGDGQGSAYTLNAVLSPYQAEGTLVSPVQIAYGTTDLPRDSQVDTDKSYYQITGLTPGETYAIIVTNMDTPYSAGFYVYDDVTKFGSNVYGDYPCYRYPQAGKDVYCAVKAVSSSLWVMMDGNSWGGAQGSGFTLNADLANLAETYDVSNPMIFGTNVLPHAGQVDERSSSYLITGLEPNELYKVTLTNLTGDVDMHVDPTYIYGGHYCSSLNTGTTDEECIEQASSEGRLVITVDGSKTFYGGRFTLGVSAGARSEGSRDNPLTKAADQNELPYSGQTGYGYSYYKITGLTPGRLHEVTMSNLTNSARLYVFDNGGFSIWGSGDTGPQCSSPYGSTNKLCGAMPNDMGELYLMVSGSEDGVHYTLDVKPGLQAQGTVASPYLLDYSGSDLPHSGTVDWTASYYRVTGLTRRTGYYITLTNNTDRVWANVYTDPAFWSPTLCQINIDNKRGCLVTTAKQQRNSDLYIKVPSINTLAGAHFDLNVLPAPITEGSTAAPMELAYGTTVIPHQGQVAASPSYYQISGLTAGNSYKVRIPSMYQDVHLYVYDNQANLGSTATYSCMSANYNLGQEECTVTVPVTSNSLWVMIMPRFSSDSTYFTLSVE